jgi:hypothetical protein
MPHEGNADSTAEFADQLSAIETLVEDNVNCHVVVGGDFNVNLSRDWLHTGMHCSFCDNMGLHFATSRNNCNVDYTYNFNMSRFSVLDHFLLSGVLFENSVDSTRVIHDTDNPSDHEPLVLGLSLKMQFLGFRDRVHMPRTSWAKATESDMCNYRYELTRQLRCIKLPADAVLCSDLQCRNPVHLQAINNYARDITNASLVAAAATIPQTCIRQTSGRIPGWSKHVQPLKEKSIFWPRVWMDCDRPRNWIVPEAMRRNRAAYHYAFRKIRQDEDAIVRERIAESILNNNDHSFRTEIKRLRSSKAGLSNLVDGHTDVNSIAQLFEVKYRQLYTSVPCDEVELQSLIDKVNALTLNTLITTDCLNRMKFKQLFRV